MLTLNDIKKTLYRESVRADLLQVNKNGLRYESVIDLGPDESGMVIEFHVPLNDLGDGKFYPSMQAKHLIRYLVYES